MHEIRATMAPEHVAEAVRPAHASGIDLSSAEYSLTSRELRAIVDRTDLAEVTRPTSEPFPGVIQDLWQLSHVTASYVGRAGRGRHPSRHGHYRR